MSTGRIWKARMRKAYVDETNHVVVGEVLEEHPLYLKMRCRAFHFRRPTVNANITASETKVRLFPWDSIAYITEVLDPVDWERAAAVLDEKGDVILKPAVGLDKVQLREGLDG